MAERPAAVAPVAARGAVLALAAALVLAACGPSAKAGWTPPASSSAEASAAKPLLLRLAETQGWDYPTTQGDYKFAQLVRERSGGRIVIAVYPGSQLGQEKSVIEQVRFGAIDFTRVSLSPLGAFAPQMNALQMPYLYRNGDHYWKVLKGTVGKELLASLEPAGFIGLGWFEAGARSFYNAKRPVRHPADLRGLRIRAQENDLMVDMVNAFGAVATPMPYGEVYAALQTGDIDGAENNWPSYYATKHYEVAKYLTLDEHTRVPEIIIASKISMDSLSAEDRAIVQSAAWDAIDYQRSEWALYERLAQDKVRAAGTEVVELKDKGEWQERMRALYGKQSREIRDLLRRIEETR